MISAPARTPETMTPETLSSTPSIKTHGHLALLEWDDMPGTKAPASPAPDFGLPLRKSVLDRCYDGGTLALLAVTVAALAASLSRF